MGTARNMFPSKDKRDLTKPILREDLIQYDDLNGAGGGGGGTVTGVTAVGPITSSGGTAPVISTSMATNRLIGRTGIGTGVMEEITVGTGLSLSGGTLSNSGLTAVPTIQQTIQAGKSITFDILTIGTSAGDNVTTAHSIAIGEDALIYTNGGNNVAIGYKAGSSPVLQTNSYNVTIGSNAGESVADTETENIAIGRNAYKGGQSSNNVAIGTNAGFGDTGGTFGFGNSVFIGTDAGYDRLGAASNTGDAVVAIGNVSMTANTGSAAIGIGAGAGGFNTGDNAVMIGQSSGVNNTGGDLVSIGNGAGSNSSGVENIFLGTAAGNNNAASRVIALGTNAGDTNSEPGQFIISNQFLPSFTDTATANTFYSASTGLSTGCTYLYYNQQTEAIGAYRT